MNNVERWVVVTHDDEGEIVSAIGPVLCESDANSLLRQQEACYGNGQFYTTVARLWQEPVDRQTVANYLQSVCPSALAMLATGYHQHSKPLTDVMGARVASDIGRKAATLIRAHLRLAKAKGADVHCWALLSDLENLKAS